MGKLRWGLGVPLLACTSGDVTAEQGSDNAIESLSLTAANDATETGGSSETGAGPSSTTPDDDGGDEDSGPASPKYDVGDTGFCEDKLAGIYCDEATARECDAAGALVDTVDCAPDLCVDGTGCVTCVAGEFDCQGNKVMSCNAAVIPATWEAIDTCSPAAGEGCDRVTGTCEVLQPVGNNVPTGVYHQFADFRTGTSQYKGGYDVDGYDDRLYTVRSASAIDVYQLALLDSDGDGELEPNQHPDNPDAPGPVETRTLTFLETIATPVSASPNGNELFVLEDRLYMGGLSLQEMVFGAAATKYSTKPTWLGRFSHIGYDETRERFYASNEQRRRVLQHDPVDDSWGIAFVYPTLAGGHMDGMEVVVDPTTDTQYVYVSDMTSDFIGQYRLDRQLGWVQENLFAYSGTTGSLVEGMGFGALNHFWATGGGTLYEVGGGDLAQYTEPQG